MSWLLLTESRVLTRAAYKPTSKLFVLALLEQILEFRNEEQDTVICLCVWLLTRL